MRVDAQLLTGLWHACGRPCRSRAWRAASCELLAGLFSRENRHLSRAVHQESSCPAHAHRARASCLPDSNPYGRDGLAHSRSLSTARRALRVA